MDSSSATRERRDCVVIGARCSGATLATYLARAGASVLLVDRSPLPSDLVLSTHTLHPASLEVLDELGLSAALRAVSPPIRKLRFGRGSGTLDVELEGERVEYCPRRERFDRLLQDAARAAGAEVCERTTAKQLFTRAGRVVGVRLEGPSGVREVYADWVVGADGRDSWLARQVRAEEYLSYEAARAMYWSYWDAPRGYGDSSDYPAGMYVVNRDGTIRVAFHTDHGQVLAGSMPERRELARWRSDPLGTLQADLRRDSMLATFTQSAPRAKVRGFIAQRYFLRCPVGPGWILIGDAGVHKEFVTGDGMTEALLQARAAAAALSGGEPALARWGRARDVAALPFFFFGKLQGAPGVPSELEALVLERSAERPEVARRFAQSLTHQVSPLDVVTAGQALRWMLPEVLRGRLGLMGQLLRRAALVGPMLRRLEQARAEAA
jgi:flavin-dependent dehydrogenase